MKFKYPKIIKNNVIKDNRGSLLEIFHNKRFKEKFPFALFVTSKKMYLEDCTFKKKAASKTCYYCLRKDN